MRGLGLLGIKKRGSHEPPPTEQWDKTNNRNLPPSNVSVLSHLTVGERFVQRPHTVRTRYDHNFRIDILRAGIAGDPSYRWFGQIAPGFAVPGQAAP